MQALAHLLHWMIAAMTALNACGGDRHKKSRKLCRRLAGCALARYGLGSGKFVCFAQSWGSRDQATVQLSGRASSAGSGLQSGFRYDIAWSLRSNSPAFGYQHDGQLPERPRLAVTSLVDRPLNAQSVTGFCCADPHTPLCLGRGFAKRRRFQNFKFWRRTVLNRTP